MIIVKIFERFQQLKSQIQAQSKFYVKRPMGSRKNKFGTSDFRNLL